MFVRVILFLLWLSAIIFVIVGSLSQDLAPPSGQVIDKAIHAGTYFFLTFLGWLVFTGTGPRWAMTGFLFGFGVTLEILQAIVGGREASGLDMLANTAGIAIAAIVFRHAVNHLAPLRFLVTGKSGGGRS